MKGPCIAHNELLRRFHDFPTSPFKFPIQDTSLKSRGLLRICEIFLIMCASPGHPPAPGVRGCLGGGQGRAQAAGSADRPLHAAGQHRQVRYRIQMGQRGFRFTLISISDHQDLYDI